MTVRVISLHVSHSVPGPNALRRSARSGAAAGAPRPLPSRRPLAARDSRAGSPLPLPACPRGGAARPPQGRGGAGPSPPGQSCRFASLRFTLLRFASLRFASPGCGTGGGRGRLCPCELPPPRAGPGVPWQSTNRPPPTITRVCVAKLFQHIHRGFCLLSGFNCVPDFLLA